MFNINNRFDFFDEPISFFEDIEPDFSFEKDRRKLTDKKKYIFFTISNYKSKKQINYFAVNNVYKFNILKNNFSIIEMFNNKKLIILTNSKSYFNFKNYCFERISFMQIPPKRVIIRDFDE